MQPGAEAGTPTMQAMDALKRARSTSNSQQPDWSDGLDVNVLQLVSSKLDSPYVPGALHLSSTCSTWRAAAGRVPTADIAWQSRQPSSKCEETRRVQLVQKSFKPWLLKAAPQLESFQLVCTQPHVMPEAEADAVCAVWEEAALAAVAAGAPLPLQQLQLPLPASIWSKLPAALVGALPHLRSLSVGMVKGDTKETAALLAALGGLPHLTSLEVGLPTNEVTGMPWFKTADRWETLVEAAPKQLQRLAVRVGFFDKHCARNFGPKYTWTPLAAFTHLKQLQLAAVRADDLSPLAALAALTSLGLEWEGWDWEPLVGVKGLLRDLEVDDVGASNQEYLQQLTALTSLVLRETEPTCSIPEQVASGLQRLDWGLYPSYSRNRGTSTGPDLLRHCSSSNLRELQLRGRPWFPDWTASEALQRLTGLTCFGLHAKWSSGEPPTTLSLKRWSLAIQYVKQLCRLELPSHLLVTGGAWLGRLPHLTSLRLTAEWPLLAPVEEGLVQGVVDPQVLSNLHSCRAGLQVLEVQLATCDREGDDPLPEQVVPAVRQLLQREVPGVQLLVTWEEIGDVPEEEEDGCAYRYTSSDSDQ